MNKKATITDQKNQNSKLSEADKKAIDKGVGIREKSDQQHITRK